MTTEEQSPDIQQINGAEEDDDDAHEQDGDQSASNSSSVPAPRRGPGFFVRNENNA